MTSTWTLRRRNLFQQRLPLTRSSVSSSLPSWFPIVSTFSWYIRSGGRLCTWTQNGDQVKLMLQIGVRVLHGLRTKRNPSTNQRARSRMVCLSSSVLNLKRKRLSPTSFTETPLVVFQALDRIALILFLLMVLRAIK